MSKLGQKKKKVNYEGSVPRCSICRHFKEQRIALTTNSKTVRINMHCGIHLFTIGKNGCCDDFTDVDGNTFTRELQS